MLNGPGQADVLYGLGIALGRAGEAREAWLTAVRIFDRYSDPRAAELRGRLEGPPEPQARVLGQAGAAAYTGAGWFSRRRGPGGLH